MKEYEIFYRRSGIKSRAFGWSARDAIVRDHEEAGDECPPLVAALPSEPWHVKAVHDGDCYFFKIGE
ncbi:MAG: hypothetical protein DI596_11625 [Azospira oryzae]|uniref:Uncharacterized protein n=1 Tax=Pelomicrobium methylotrophicum TaxID=2602750 RepID=A0A5C7EKQ6_9PROT|nr:hypothetical protein [Pelomicrobium methylotrophicum]PZP55297.1 MAG: hypothetical protein DI596_11625 [Azospira oryzae]PZP77832.1 MAG: hypothetical protein DI593_11625 [Azospira oryzae]TXF11628.1 hypothetical protein FR698_09830 [Pelomicrobium methylotrophicum]